VCDVLADGFVSYLGYAESEKMFVGYVIQCRKRTSAIRSSAKASSRCNPQRSDTQPTRVSDSES
jgi:hypothetical protein